MSYDERSRARREWEAIEAADPWMNTSGFVGVVGFVFLISAALADVLGPRAVQIASAGMIAVAVVMFATGLSVYLWHRTR